MPKGTPSIKTLQTHGTDLLRQYVEADAKRTEVLRSLAKVVVGIRAQTMTGDGRTPDWAGQSQSYRDTIRAMYDDAGIPTDASANVQAALRYHIGEVLREVVSPAALTKAGLATKGPRDRARLRTAAPESTSPSPSAEAPSDPEDAMRAAIQYVQHAHATPAPKDPSVLLILCLSLEHACQVLREQIQSQAERAALSPAPAGNGTKPAPAKRTRKALAKAA